LYIPVGPEPPDTVKTIHAITRVIRRNCYSLLYNDIDKYMELHYAVKRPRHVYILSIVETMVISSCNQAVLSEEVEVNNKLKLTSLIGKCKTAYLKDLWSAPKLTRSEYFVECLNCPKVFVKNDTNLFESFRVLPCMVLRCLIQEKALLNENELNAFILTFDEVACQQTKPGSDQV
jgi:hypothetical protein